MHDSTSTSLARLDRAINERILSAPTDAETLAWWQQKMEAKRELGRLPPAQALAAADRLASELERISR